MLDVVPIDDDFDIYEVPGRPQGVPELVGEPTGSITFRRCDVSHWESLRDAFLSFEHIDIAVANAGINQTTDFLEDVLDNDGKLLEPNLKVVDVNFRSVVWFTKLAIRQFRKQAPGGSLVLTTSCLAYSPEHSLPVYSATKAGVGACAACGGGCLLLTRCSCSVLFAACVQTPRGTG